MVIANSLSHPCTVLGALSDGRDRLLINVVLDVLTIDVRDDVLINSVTTVTVGVGVAMLADVEVTELVAVTITLEFAAPLLYAVDDVRASINIGVLTGVRVNFGVSVIVDALARVFAASINGVVPDVGVDMLTSLEFIMTSSLEE